MLFPRSSRRRTRLGVLPLLFLTVLGLLVGGLGAPAYAANTISGIVKNRDGLALSGVTVKLGTDVNDAFQQEGSSKTTDANGAYTFTGVTDGDYFIQYTGAPGVDPAAYYDGENQPVVTALADATAVSSGANDSSANPRLLSRTITGKITTGSPAVPVEGVTVKVEAATGSPRAYTAQPTTPSSVTTDAQGNYAFSVAEQSNLILEFSKPGYQTVYVKDASTTAQKDEASLITFASKGTPTTVNRSIAATPGGISGKVTRADSVRTPAIAGAKVTLLTSTGGNSGIATELTNGEGSYAFTNVPPAKYQVKFETPTGAGYETEFYNEKAADGTPDLVEVKPGVANDAINATLVKAATSEISGVVTTPSGVPIKDVSVSLHVRTNASGGTGAVEYSPALSATSGTGYIGMTTGGDGAFALEGNLNQPYVVQFRSNAFQTVYFNGGGAGSTNADTAQTITLTKTAGARANVSVALNAGVTFSGTVTDDAATPAVLKDVEVSALYPVTQSNGGVVWTSAGSVKTATDGTYRLVAPTQAGRDYILSFAYPNRLTQYYRAETSGNRFLTGDAKRFSGAAATQFTSLNESIVKRTAVTGKVTDPQGLPVSGASVTPVTYSTAKGAWDPANGYADAVSTGNDGVFVMQIKADGRDKPFRLQVTKGDSRAARFFPDAYTPDEASNIVVAEDQVSAGKNVALPAASQLAGTVTNADGTAYTGGGAVELWRAVSFTSSRELGGANKSEWRRFGRASLGSGGTFSISTTFNDSTAPAGTSPVAGTSTGLPPGTYKIKAMVADNQEGFLPGLVGIDQAPGVALGVEQQLNLQKYALPSTAEIRGAVTNITGAAVANEQISAVYRYVTNVVDGAPVLSSWLAATPSKATDSAGSYVLRVPSRTYRVGALGTGGAVDIPGSGAGPNDRGYYTSDAAPTNLVADADDVILGSQDVTGIDFRLNIGEPVNIQPPYITGISAEGERLTAQPGTWSASDVVYTYQWYSASQGSPNTFTPINGATSRTYDIPGRMLPLPGVPGFTPARYFVEVTATRQTSSRESATIGADVPTGLSVESEPFLGADTTTENRQRPQITGKAIVGETLTATDGVWSEGGNFTYQWLADGQVVPGATTKTLQIPADLLTKTLSFRVTHTEGSGSSQVVIPAVSKNTAAVGKGALKNVTLPVISGDALVGKTLTADPGTWNDASPTFAYQWLANSQPIVGATTNKLVLSDAELGKSIAVQVTASKGAAYSAGQATSASTAAVGDDPTKVVNKTKPIISGTAKVGETLATTDGTWSNQPTGFAYQWLADGTVVAGATNPTFVLTKDQRGKKMSVRVTASKTGLTTGTATSEETGAVAGGPLENKTKPSITGQTLEGATLTADPGTWDPSTVTPVFSYQWVADGANIAGATSQTYTLTSAEVGKTVSVKVTASANGFDSGTATSTGVGPIDEPQGEIVVTGGPSIAGKDVVGETLSLNPGSVTPGDATIAVQWFRDGTAITGATARTYRLVAADEDALITARVTYTKDDFVTLVKSTSAVGPVEPEAEAPEQEKPTLKTSKKVKGKKLVVKVRVLADNQSPVTGQVELTEGKKLYALKTLNNGKKKLVVKGLKKGFHSVKLTYLGNDLVKKRAKTLSFSIG